MARAHSESAFCGDSRQHAGKPCGGLVDGSVRRARRIDVDTTALSGPDPVRKHDRSAEGLNPRRDYFGSSVQRGDPHRFCTGLLCCRQS
jgi:hypothetical protein